jgi:hypothetical protein
MGEERELQMGGDYFEDLKLCRNKILFTDPSTTLAVCSVYTEPKGRLTNSNESARKLSLPNGNLPAGTEENNEKFQSREMVSRMQVRRYINTFCNKGLSVPRGDSTEVFRKRPTR